MSLLTWLSPGPRTRSDTGNKELIEEVSSTSYSAQPESTSNLATSSRSTSRQSTSSKTKSKTSLRKRKKLEKLKQNGRQPSIGPSCKTEEFSAKPANMQEPLRIKLAEESRKVHS